jgi:hypothetical protein
VDPVPDSLLRQFGSTGNRTRDLWICSQELWTLDHRGGQIYIRSFVSSIPFFFQPETLTPSVARAFSRICNWANTEPLKTTQRIGNPNGDSLSHCAHVIWEVWSYVSWLYTSLRIQFKEKSAAQEVGSHIFSVLPETYLPAYATRMCCRHFSEWPQPAVFNLRTDEFRKGPVMTAQRRSEPLIAQL